MSYLVKIIDVQRLKLFGLFTFVSCRYRHSGPLQIVGPSRTGGWRLSTLEPEEYENEQVDLVFGIVGRCE